jgi:hypothetical protein
MENVSVRHIDGRLNLADIFTKFVSNEVLRRLKPSVMGESKPPTEVTSKDEVKIENLDD